jgi:hypothetical protein
VPYNEQRAVARESYRRAMQAMGPELSPPLVWCVLQMTPSPDLAPTVEKWAESVGWRTERAVGFLAAALEALAQHYGICRAHCPTRKREDLERRQRERGEP